ncbi:ATPase family protein associated with various cellular activities (AAA) [Anseongella ginsenosidimutans]|uniref:ATPase family protein associated with various cellular activities (AAA) n=1 Tax=Anseongella ginsenosidimutans TaxID=496056 RepID=A0A4R3KMH3_9SPHI|nr:ATP-binding protein [Anseongella ginsenosidimutans]QEC51966.1 AAA family ATPase [Anseongella ginsenosidimutans]TCS84753.1 ATPase family protein associated with various cellular activities (AAA) [Anseongella ginsenosidimutans]
MSQADYIKDIARFGLENDREKLLDSLNELIEHSKSTKKVNFALQLQSIIKESLRRQEVSGMTKVGSPSHYQQLQDRETDELILEKLTSDYSLENLVCSDMVRGKLLHFLQEHQSIELLNRYQLPISNKLLLHGPSGCGKTLASYVIAGELKKMMIVVNLGAIVSAKLGETSKNLAKLFRRAATEDCIIFLDEFDSLGKVRDYNQDHGEMKRVVNTILQLFDYLPQSSIAIAATNQKDMLDEAIMRRFDMSIGFPLPSMEKIKELITLTLRNGDFTFDNKAAVSGIIKLAEGLSYYSIQKTLLNTIKRSLFTQEGNSRNLKPKINTTIWRQLVQEEKEALQTTLA